MTVLLLTGGMRQAKAQALAIRTNVAGFTVMAANVGADFVLNEKHSLSGSFYQTMGESWIRKTKATGAQLSWRYWFSHEPLRGLYWGLSVGVGSYELEMDGGGMDMAFSPTALATEKCPMKYAGTAMPMSIDIGYCFQLSRRWSLDIYAGVGPLLRWEEVTFEDEELGTQVYIPRRSRADFHPTNAGLSLVYLIL